MHLDESIEKLCISKVDNGLKFQIAQHMQDYNNIDCIADIILIQFKEDELLRIIDISELYTHLRSYKKIGQLALNVYKNNMCEMILQQCVVEDRGFCNQCNTRECIHCFFKERYGDIHKGRMEERDIVDIISKYLIIFNMLYQMEYRDNCECCETSLGRLDEVCPVCGHNKKNTKSPKDVSYSNKKEEPSDGRECFYCNNEIINGICSVCGAESELGIPEEEISHTKTSYFQQNKEASTDNERSDPGHLKHDIDMALQHVQGSIINMDRVQEEQDSNHLDHDIDKSCQDIGGQIIYASKAQVEHDSKHLDNRIHKSLENNQGSILSMTKFRKEDHNNLNDNSITFDDCVPYWICNRCSFHNNDTNNPICGTCMASQESIVNMDTLQEKRDSNHFGQDIDMPLQGSTKNVIKLAKEDHNYLNNSDTMSNESQSYWTCKRCSFHNTDINNPSCDICMYNKDREGEIVNKDRLQGECELINFKSSSVHNNNHTTNMMSTSSISTDNSRDIEIEDCWNCTHCTFTNKMFDNMCQACLEPKNDSEEDIGSPEETWICKECSTNNSYDSYRCYNCRALGAFVNKWRCEKCSFYNDKLSRKCGACEMMNDNLTKCPKCLTSYINRYYDIMCLRCHEKTEEPRSDTIMAQQSRSKELHPNEQIRIAERINQWNVRGRDPLENSSTRNIDRRTGNNVSCGKNEYLYEREKSSDINRTDRRNIESGKSKNINDEKYTKSSVDNIKMNKPKCRYCKIQLKDHEYLCCAKCESKRWYCQNEGCSRINFDTKYCSKCKAKKYSKFSDCTNFVVLVNKSEQYMWQCGYCWGFCPGRSQKCVCGNLRYTGSYKKCSCKWINLSVKSECAKCYKRLN